MKLKQLSLVIPNEPGALVRVCEVLKKHSVNISTLTLADTANFGILRLIIQEWEEGLKALEDDGLVVKVSDVLAISIPHVPGGLLKILELLNENRINVEYMYGFSLSTRERSVQIFRLDDTDRAIEVLEQAEVCLLEPDELFQKECDSIRKSPI